MSDAPKTVLVIEDDRETADLIAEELTDRGYEVRIAYDGQEGCSAIFKAAPDLVLSDLLMPVMSGFDILERLAAEASYFRDIPFVFLTGMSGRDVELKARRLGADDFLTKPIDFDMLEAGRSRVSRRRRLGSIIRRRSEASNDTSRRARTCRALMPL
jgi:DNA-binding response OmpR family regulator